MKLLDNIFFIKGQLSEVKFRWLVYLLQSFICVNNTNTEENPIFEEIRTFEDKIVFAYFKWFFVQNTGISYYLAGL